MRRSRSFLVLGFLVFTAALTAPAHGAVKRMFVTSAYGNANLGGWPVIAGQNKTGAAAGDAICQTLAAQAGLTNPAAFRAWLSTATDDAFCRVRSSSGHGTRAGRCGGIDPLVFAILTAGPWVRTDGYPFAPKEPQLAKAVGGAVLVPALFDELGNPVDPGLTFGWTGTAADGTALPQRCNDWTSANVGTAGMLGHASETTVHWTDEGAPGTCNSQQHLYCFETGTNGDPLPAVEAPGALAFLTSARGTGNLASWPGAQGTGIAAGDSICQAAAAAGGLPSPGSFRAWLSFARGDAVDRFTIDGPWKRPDGTLVALSKADLTDGQLWSTITQDEMGNYAAPTSVWTGTYADGTAAVAHDCGRWTDGSGANEGLVGTAMHSLGTWTDVVDVRCDYFFSLYCLSDTVTP
jgi:hypothetical protein